MQAVVLITSKRVVLITCKRIVLITCKRVVLEDVTQVMQVFVLEKAGCELQGETCAEKGV